MSICSICGQPIIFRYIDRRCVPIHAYGGCIQIENKHVENIGYNADYESKCYLTCCPICGSEVYFIRHNGGAVWIDPPLGPPWFKHPCMEAAQNSAENKESILSASLINIEKEKCNKDNLLLGVVSSSECYGDKKCTILKFATGNDHEIILLAKWNASHLFSKICIFDIDKYLIYDINNKDLPCKVVCIIYPSCNSEKTIECPECNKDMKVSNSLKHFRECHFYNILNILDL